MAIQETIPDSQIHGVQQYSTQDPTKGLDEGDLVPHVMSILERAGILAKLGISMSPGPNPGVPPPPHPTITQPLKAIPLGFSMAYQQLQSPTVYGGVITNYKIYRNKSANSFSGAQLWETRPHDNATNQKIVTLQDSSAGGAQNWFYFITSIDSFGQESSQPGSFQGSAVTSGAANPNVAQVVGTTSSPTTTSSTYAVIPEMTQTITTKGNKVLIVFSGSFDFSTYVAGLNALILAVFRDGTQLSVDLQNNLGNASFDAALTAITWVDSPAAGSHTFDVRWRGTYRQVRQYGP